MLWIIELVSWLLILPGCFFLLVGGYGLVRLPDLYTRLHAASMTDTGATILIILGLCMQAVFVFESFSALAKLLLILFFSMFTTPTASHALAKSALMGGLIPTDREGKALFDSTTDVEELADPEKNESRRPN